MLPFAMKAFNAVKMRFLRCSSIPMYSFLIIHPSISMQYRFFWSKDNNQKDTTGPRLFCSSPEVKNFPALICEEMEKLYK